MWRGGGGRQAGRQAEAYTYLPDPGRQHEHDLRSIGPAAHTDLLLFDGIGRFGERLHNPFQNRTRGAQPSA